MIDINELRRLTQAATPGPWHATRSVETNSWAVWSDTTRLMELRPTKTVDMYQVSNTAAFIAAASPAAISELLDRLEAAESDALEQARLNGMGGEREAALLAKLEAAEKERDALRAKIEAMEKQVPICRAEDLKHAESLLPMLGLKPESHLYALPGAQPAPMAVAYLDLGAGGYMDIGTDLTDEALAALPNGRHMLGIVGTYGVEGYIQAQPAPSVPTALLVAVADLVAQMEIVARVGFVDVPDDKDSCAAFCVAEGTWLELMRCVESLAASLAAVPEVKP